MHRSGPRSHSPNVNVLVLRGPEVDEARHASHRAPLIARASPIGTIAPQGCTATPSQCNVVLAEHLAVHFPVLCQPLSAAIFKLTEKMFRVISLSCVSNCARTLNWLAT